MRYASVCSGIEAPTQAWHPLGWEPVFFSEIEKFPSAVLNHHYPSVPNYGDMTNFKEWPDHGQNSDKPIDLLVGGTPCQSFSIAGMRKGLSDPRGDLMLTFGAIAARYRPKFFVWENVPGVLSSNEGRDFASFLGLLSGQQLDVPECGWRNAGIISGYKNAYGIAYRVLDAQYARVDGFAGAVPQRRRRVIAVGYIGDWRRAAAVLFDSQSLCWDSTPSRKTREGITDDAATGPGKGGGLNNRVAPTLDCATDQKFGSNQWVDSGSFVFDEVGKTLLANHTSHAADKESYVAHTLKGEGFDASEDGTGRGTPIIPVAFSSKDYGGDAELNLSPTLRAGNSAGNRPNGGSPPAIAFMAGQGAKSGGVGASDVVSPTLRASESGSNQVPSLATHSVVAVADTLTVGANQKTGMFSPELAANDNYAVRRLTPIECERLQGFPDDFTKIPYRKKTPENCPDGPRYKALGNSMAVNKMRWVGQRIQTVMEIK